ncbi:XRE family transcriptional regulator [Avibacterium paragallinarum]|uniref:Helix-turn-helix domain-containing protein n=1 Tax=Avibacterium paragallinarum TaxID=728 RepID=A0ABU7QEK2_AVIPA|nr:S24 family peptidase [Avibacterium paragallinarum]QZP16143.1 helix-turn-helix domain-containing protein [Avibacterium paragallinarum]WAL56717.1 helix-turn-helix domain-containing protein [Avibacterium paragallinarum]WAM59237.1 helix-turn-helix domain-containing protein [Avibacterium paragallinarum]
MASKFKNNSLIGSRIREHREKLNLTRPELAKAVDVSLSALQGWEMNEREPQASMIITIAKELKVTPNYLLTGEEGQSSALIEKAKNVIEDIVTMITSYGSVNVSAGFGSFNEGVTKPDGREPYSSELLQMLRVNPKKCAVFWANGDSMIPTIADGDQLLVDLSKNEVKGGDKIYLVQNGESVWVKRVKMKWDGVELVSDNKEEYPPIKITADEAQNLQIIGQVVHIGHSLV